MKRIPQYDVAKNQFPRDGYILKRWYMCGTCMLDLITVNNWIWDYDHAVEIKETLTKSSFRDSTFWVLTEDEVNSMVLPRII